MNVFDMIGPVMIGPSSSHTAGSARIGLVARVLLNDIIVKAEVFLHGSFAQTYTGHGTDRAIAAGLLGFSTEDERLKDALNIAVSQGVDIVFHTADLGDVHPNTVKISCTGASGKSLTLTASSVGGGNILVVNVQGLPVRFSAEHHTLIVLYQDTVGIIASVTNCLAEIHVNIAQMRVTREEPGSLAIMIIETDKAFDRRVVDKIAAISHIVSVSLVTPV